MAKIADLGEKFDVLRGFPECSAHMRRVSLCWQDKQVADNLGVRQESWSRMKKGKLDLDVAQGALLLELCGIYHVSGDVFFKPMAEFKRILEPIGLAGRHQFGALYPLWEARQDRGLSFLRPQTRLHSQTRGFTSGTTDVLTFRIGELASIAIDHPPGGFIILFEIGPKKIELLVPSLHRTDIALQRGRTILPAEKSFFAIGGPPGDYWLLAAITESPPNLPVWARPQSFGTQGPACVLDEEKQMKFVELLQKRQRLDVFVLPYEVIRSNVP